MTHNGNLYVIGIGPGDPDLMTLKAVKILKKVTVLCFPKGKEEGNSIAMSIVSKIISFDGKEIINTHFPMRKTRIQNTEYRTQNTDEKNLGSGFCILNSDSELDTKWQETIEVILNRVNKGIDVAFLTLGDPTIYSTFFYLYRKFIELNSKINIEIIPGVSSITAAASRAKIPLALADESIAILPANYVYDLKETLERFDTVVLMKVHRNFDDILKTLKEMHLLNNAIYISKAGMEDEEIFNISEIKEKELNYFSMVIVRK